jgi:hypothetical protein
MSETLLIIRAIGAAIACGCALLALAPGARAQSQQYADELVARAQSLNLAADPYWLQLLHYKRDRLGGYTSQADDPVFFNHPRGKHEPALELEATLRAFFEADNGDDQPQCRFPARYHWLDEKLTLDSRRLPRAACAELRLWLDTLSAHSATLVFPAAYLNGPSSMFGHTLLRINPGDSRRDVPLAAYALNYAANADPADNGAFYAYKGIFGGYPGVFSIVPYYQKIKEYSDLENRDVWEYALNLDQAEVDQLMRHAWEVRHVNFDYYFLTENCSYHMLSLLEVARPGVRLTDQFSVKAIPSDTVRAVVAAGMVSSVDYRPSATTVIDQHLALLDPDQHKLVLALADGHEDAGQVSSRNGPDQSASRLLELAYDFSRYRALQNAAVRDEHAGQSYRLLQARSELPAGDVWPQTQRPSTRPEQGHGTSRLALGGGRLDGDNFVSLRFRPAYHDILDPLPGYSRGAQINFLDVRGRYFVDAHSLKLDKFTVIDILSLTPRTDFFKPISWGVDTGVERMYTNRGRTTGAQVAAGGGVSYAAPGDSLVYALLQGQLKVAHQFEQDFTLGGGLMAGVLLPVGDSTANLEVRGLRYQLGETDSFFQARWRQSFPLGSQLAFRYELEYRHERGHGYQLAEATLNWYF